MQKFMSYIKEKFQIKQKEYQMQYALIDLRGYTEDASHINFIWFNNLIKDVIFTPGAKIEDMTLIMKLIDIQFKTSKLYMYPILAIYILFVMIPLVIQMM